MKITKLTIQDFLGIRMLKFDKCGKLNYVTGDNGVGKSSVLKAIKEAFSASYGKDPNIVHVGKDKAEIMIELDGAVTIERKFNAAGANTLKVVDNGQPVSKPQTFLDSLFGPNVFNPVAFFLASPADRRSLIMTALDLKVTEKEMAKMLSEYAALVDFTRYDFSKHALTLIEQIRTEVYERRAEQNRNLIRMKKSIEQDRLEMPQTFDPDEFKDFNYQAAMDAYEVAQEEIAEHNQAMAKREGLRARYNQIQIDIQSLREKIAKLEEEAAGILEQGTKLKGETEAFVAQDIEGMRKRLDAFQASQKLIVKMDSIRDREKELDDAEIEHSDLDSLHKLLAESVPKQVLMAAQVPLEGFEIRNDDVYVGGVAFDKLSQSEQIRFGVRLARFLSNDKKLKVILVDGIEALSKKNRDAFITEAKDDEYEYFITHVTDGELAIDAH
jgi:recombinational DNA repair ATPase RecF